MISPSDVVANLTSAIETGDFEGVKICYSPDVVVWANFDGKALDGYLWIKHPGESDGTCNRNEPTSGTWFGPWALDIVTRSLALGLLR